MVVCTLHWYYSPAHLEEVLAEMRSRGAPTLRGHFDREAGIFLLREGTHRIRAAHELGLAPHLVEIPWWRSRQSLISARFAAARRGLTFPHVHLDTRVRPE